MFIPERESTILLVSMTPKSIKRQAAFLINSDRVLGVWAGILYRWQRFWQFLEVNCRMTLPNAVIKKSFHNVSVFTANFPADEIDRLIC